MNITVGEVLRQLRRQQGLTQSELGGEQFSKSYISAVEHDKIVPSYEAIRHFAWRLDQDKDYFEQFLHQPTSFLSSSTSSTSFASSPDSYDLMLESALSFLNVLEKDGLFPSEYPLQEGFVLPSDVLPMLSKEKHTAYLFWNGYRARQKGNFAGALSAYETALGITQEKYRVVILDEIGTCHALSSAYHLALNAHDRALKLLEAATEKHKMSPMKLRVELHCAQDHQALGQHITACACYKAAKDLLQGNSDMKEAAQIYAGLGYCTYASVFQEEQHASTSRKEHNGVFQQAIDSLVQACTLYSISNEPIDESKTRLIWMRVLLDDCIHRLGSVHIHTTTLDATEIAYCTALLQKAEEQCHKILTIEQEEQTLATSLYDEAQTRLLLLLASLLSIYVQRAILAGNDGNKSAAKGAMVRAIWFCQQTLPSLTTEASLLSWTQIQELMDAPMSVEESVQLALPPLPLLNVPSLQESLAELSLTVGMLVELLAATATTDAARNDCFLQADNLFQNALLLWKASRQELASDGTLLRRGYQYIISLLEERIVSYPSYSERYIHMLLKLLSLS